MSLINNGGSMRFNSKALPLISQRYLRSSLVVVLVAAMFVQHILVAQTKQPANEEKKKDPSFHIANMTNLGIRALNELSKGDKNTVVCPLLLYNTLSLLLLGAEGQTAKEIEGVLGFEKNELEGYSKVYENVLNSKSIWRSFSYEMSFDYPESIRPGKKYQEISSKYFKMSFAKIPDAPLKANDLWRKFSVTSKASFASDWGRRFEVKFTRKRDFFNSNNSPKSVLFMKERGTHWYYSDKLVQAVIKDYKNFNAVFILLVPRERNGISKLLSLTYGDIKYLLKHQDYREGTMEMPKVIINSKKSLKTALEKMGVLLTFREQKADFSSMWPVPAYIDNIESSVTLELSEERTDIKNEVTMLGGVLGGPEGSPIEVIADHPYMFIIYDEELGLPLFIGVVYEP